MRLLAGAWTADVIWYLREGERCFTELQHDVNGVSAKVLTNCLRKLARDGIIARLTRPTSPPTVWYALTPVGRELSVALANVVAVAQRLKPMQAACSSEIAVCKPAAVHVQRVAGNKRGLLAEQE
jgi:DNA-binding HxlR family transcriptional regulator